MHVLSPQQVRWLRSAGQAIGSGVRLGSVPEVVDRVFAVQSQDESAAALGLRARGRRIGLDDVRHAVHVGRGVMRGWLMRGTLYTVPARDYHWLLGLYGPIVLKAGARRRRALGLDDALCAEAETVIVKTLAAEGAATRGELTVRLAGLGIDPHGQAVFHLLRLAALRGLVCLGPRRSGEQAYALLDQWLPDDGGGPSGDDAVAELARRYLSAHAPAALEDFVVWSGLPRPMARRAWERLEASGETISCEVLDLRCAMPLGRAAELDALPDTAASELVPGAAPDVRLLPMYDGYLVGYRSRALCVPPAHERDVWPGGGLIRATVTVDGLVVGTWTRSRKGDGFSVRADPFDSTASMGQGLAAEILDIVRFLGASGLTAPDQG